MADVSNLRRLDHLRRPPPTQPSRRPIPTNAALVSRRREASGLQEELYYQLTPFLFDLDSFSPPCNPSGSYNLDDYTAPFSLGFDTSSETEGLGSEDGDEDEDANYLVYSSDDEAEQMNFVTDIFESREPRVMEDSNWEVDPERVESSALEFGFGPGLGSNVDLRDVGMDLETDSEEFVVNTTLINEDYEYDSFEVNNDVYLSANEREEFEWEEVSERNNSEESEILNSVIDRIEEISVSSEISATESESSRLGDDEGGEGEEEEEESNLDWEVLLAMNDLERNNSADTDESEAWRRNLPEDYILAMESDEVFAQLMENDAALKRCPPAAKSEVEKLPSVVLTKDEVGESNACAVCMDEFPVGEKLTRMPCFHLYHRECILPWLRSRNTCPVCRYELATDDAIYEKRRRARAGGLVAHFADVFESRYNAYMRA